MQRSQFSFEHILYLSILVLALFLRFGSLGQNPLDTKESILALQSLAIAQDKPVIITGEPGYVVTTAALFSLFQADEFTARVFPALFGSLLVVVPYLYKKIFGKKTALLLALFLAIDPILVAQSRAAGGSMFALFGLLAAIGFLLCRRSIPSGFFFGLAILGGVNLWLGVLIILFFGLFYFKNIHHFIRTVFEPDLMRKETGMLLLSLGATLLVFGTMFMFIPQGLSGIGSGLVGYINSWTGDDGLRLFQVLIVWALTYLPILIIGIWGIIVTNRENLGKPLMVLSIFLLAFLISVLNPEIPMQGFTWAAIPFWLLIAQMLNDFLDRLNVQNKFVWICMTVFFIVMSGFSFTNLNNLFYEESPSQEIIQGRILGVLLPFVLLLLVTILVSWSWSKKDTLTGIRTGLLIVLIVTITGSTWRATGMTNQRANELWHAAGYAVGASGLENDLATYSKWATGQATGANIIVRGIDEPSLKWELRNFKQVSSTAVTDPNYQPLIIITRLDDMVKSPSTYRGQRLTWIIRPDFDKMGGRDWFRWRLFRQMPVVKDNYILWVRNDIFPGGSAQ